MPFLDWVNKNQAKSTPREVPYHLLKRESTYGSTAGATENLIIQGDNLLALKALLPFYAGQVKCIFIDPPYNTKSAFEHYDDNLEHSQWLSMIYPRLVLLRELLAEDGSIWVSLDDNEAHYLKVLMDEVFGRRCFVTNVIWEKADSPRNSARQFSSDHDHILVYSKTPDWTPLKLPRTEEANSIYTNPDADPRGPWLPGDPYANKPYSKGIYEISGPTGRSFSPPPGRYWRISEEKLRDLDSDGRVWWGPTGNARPSIKRYLSEVSDLVPRTLWKRDSVGSNRTSKNEMRALFPMEASFGTPKPEALIQRVLQVSSQDGDLVLDSFLGSGTTAAVAHKMRRRYIGIEMGEHAKTHCVPRMEKVVAGEQGGISQAVNWQGGGGFSFYTLGDPAFDEDGRLNTVVKFPTLAAYIWHIETGIPGQQAFNSPLLGIHDGVAYFLLYNGILGDRRPSSGNVLTSAILTHLRALCPADLPFMVYGETSRIGPARLAAENIRFKQIPYDVSMR
ncbi:site-specific DNA-methyltransferase [Aquipseudomonas campi]